MKIIFYEFYFQTNHPVDIYSTQITDESSKKIILTEIWSRRRLNEGEQLVWEKKKGLITITKLE
jgi:hypothetical protein